MVRGLDIFRDFFADYRDCYVLIGGSACDVYFTDQKIPFRVTHDLDMILCVEALTPPFFNRFWEFIRAGGYVHRQKSDGHKQFYRFTAPTEPGYPAMLELFARKADFLPETPEGHLTPIPAGEEASSLSGILVATIPVRDYALPDTIKAKMREFMARYADAEVDVSALGVPLNAADVKQRLVECLGLTGLA